MELADEIIAAGGIIITWSGGAEEAGDPKVMLVHRPKYDDWSFPKGKLDPGETVEAAALREVEEETGLRCRILRELPTIRYQYRDRTGKPRPKVVHYFLMEVAGGQVAVNIYEIDEARWYDVGEAIDRLRYEHDRQLLATLLAEIRGA